MKLYNEEIKDGLTREEYLTLRNKFIMKIVIYLILIFIIFFTNIINGLIYKIVISLILFGFILMQIFFIYYFYRSQHEQKAKD